MSTETEENHNIRNAMGLFVFSAMLCGLIVVAAKSSPTGQGTAISTADTIKVAAGIYTPHAEDALLSAQVDALQNKMQSMHEDLASMHFEFVHLQETLDLMVNEIMGDLKKENEGLRDEVNRMYLRLGQANTETASAPPPPEPTPEVESESDASKETQAMFKEGEFGFVILDEWGRSPDDAARLGNNVSTLKGIIGVVPPNSSAEDLQQLGVNLRTQYSDYNNINIEVFDDKEAAESYGKHQTSNPAHQVLSISKHANSGRDVVLLILNGTTTEVPF